MGAAFLKKDQLNIRKQINFTFICQQGKRNYNLEKKAGWEEILIAYSSRKRGFSRYVTKDNTRTRSNSHKNVIALVNMDYSNTSSCDWTLNIKAQMNETHFFIINH